MNTTISTATSTVNVYQKLFTAYTDWSSIPFIALPMGICVWSFNKSQSYYQDNETFHKTIQDVIDRTTFGKVIVPLFKYINASLTKDLVKKSQLPTVSGVQEILEDSDKRKGDLIKDYDYSSLSEAIELQDSIEKIIKTRRDQTSFKSGVRKSRWFLIATTVTSAITLILGFLLVGSQATLGFNNDIVIGLFVAWGIFLVLTLICVLCFYCFKIKIEQMRYE